MQMVPVPGSEKVVDANLVLIAAGFTGSQKYVTDAFGGICRCKNKCSDKRRNV